MENNNNFKNYTLQYYIEINKSEITEHTYEYAFTFLFTSEYGVAGPHEYPPSLYKHVHALGGEDGDQIMKMGVKESKISSSKHKFLLQKMRKRNNFSSMS